MVSDHMQQMQQKIKAEIAKTAQNGIDGSKTNYISICCYGLRRIYEHREEKGRRKNASVQCGKNRIRLFIGNDLHFHDRMS